MSQGPMSTSPSKGGRFQPQQGYQRQPMPSPGSKGGQSRFPVQTQTYPMSSPGGKGGSYQRQQMPFGYGQTTFSPGQFGGYGVPSNAFSFNNPNYQPYMPPTYDSGQTGQSPDIGNNPMTPQPEVMTGQQVSTLQAPPDIYQDKIVDPRDAFTPPGGLFQSMGIGGKGGGSSYMPPEGYSSMPDPDPNALRVLDPYGPGGAYEGRPRPTFPDPTQPQGPQGTIQSAPVIDINNQALRDDLMSAAQARFAREQLRNPNVPTSDQGYSQQTTGAMNSGLGSLFNSQQLAQRMQGAVGGPRLAPSSGPVNPYAMGGSRNGQIDPRFQNMR